MEFGFYEQHVCLEGEACVQRCSEQAHVVETPDDGPLSGAGDVLNEDSVTSFALARARKVKNPPLQGLDPVLPQHLQSSTQNLGGQPETPDRRLSKGMP
jgi:hypothetical protein